MELNREQIIKALELCVEWHSTDDCYKCPYYVVEGICECAEDDFLLKQALALIKQLTEENQRLREDNEIKSQKRANIFEIVDAFERGRTDGVRKMQTRLTQYIGTYTAKSFVYVSAMFKLVDQIAKELIGDE